MKRSRLLTQALGKYLAGVLLVGLLLFLPAGTFRFFGAWLFMALLFIPMFFLGAALLVKAPELLEKRLRTKETERPQKGAVGASALLFLAGFIIAGLDCRFGWSHLPMWVTLPAAAVLLLSYALYAEVMRENAWLSRTVEVQEGQQVVDTGLYGIVRHPMYAAVTLLFLSIPLVLGSLPAFLLFLLFPAVLAGRIKNEEQVLTEGLPGYAEYKKRVKYRMIPFIW